MIQDLDAHEPPPASLRQLFKDFRRLKIAEIDTHPRVLDFSCLDNGGRSTGVYQDSVLSRQVIVEAFQDFVGHGDLDGDINEDIPIFAHRAIPGLRVIPSLLSPAVQVELLARLLHRDLSDERHQTNVHLHYHMTYPTFQSKRDSTSSAEPSATKTETSFFYDDTSRLLLPKDPAIHAPVSIRSFLDKKLRWVTLGGQYNWTDKRYPSNTPPPFPPDIARLLHDLFPATTAEAAIVNFYSPGDTLSLHRDVSEECDKGLISISFGCDGLFMVSHEDGSDCEIIRLRSGDAVYMSGTSRLAWHAVPKIIPETCPTWLQEWPGGDGDDNQFEKWRGWMAGKRINLNVRQMVE